MSDNGQCQMTIAGTGSYVPEKVLTNADLEAMVETTDGFRLAEEDLRIRGQGTIFGARQSGVADLRIASLLEDLNELVAARREAFALVATDPGLDDHPDIRDEVRALLAESVEWLFIS